MKWRLCSGFFVAEGGKVDAHRDEVIGAEAGVDVKHAGKALDGEGRADDEYEREGDFGDDQRLAKEVVAAAGGRAAFFDGGVDVVADTEQRGGETRDQGGEKRGAESEERDAGIDRNAFEARCLRRK